MKSIWQTSTWATQVTQLIFWFGFHPNEKQIWSTAGWVSPLDSFREPRSSVRATGGTPMSLGAGFPEWDMPWNPTVIRSKKWDSTSFAMLQTQGGKILTDLTVIQCFASIINPWFSCQLLQMSFCRRKGTSLLSPPPAPFIFCKFPDLETRHFLVHTYAHFSSSPWVLFRICTDSKMAQTVESAPSQRKCEQHSLVRLLGCSFSSFTT